MLLVRVFGTRRTERKRVWTLKRTLDAGLFPPRRSCTRKPAQYLSKEIDDLWSRRAEVSVLVICHTCELAFQISKEYESFSKYMSNVKCSVFFGGLPIKNEDVLKKSCPHIVVGTPG
ncbi:DEAD (Asp-Glu-Ala-Asp) box polypeptide 39Aa [Silurus asotus]|uniref:DEAD (Asp-Glu-Ala-Asp) box polypeptide 39Aa n=1 Tax=Silurus asotus TaxID=30991 RepID=A0AAD5FRH0_SILAS|nr:DEAD (Asp-Glu-Ala-Asp) box polypeptide 39Aa [Silurus asotus]